MTDLRSNYNALPAELLNHLHKYLSVGEELREELEEELWARNDYRACQYRPRSMPYKLWLHMFDLHEEIELFGYFLRVKREENPQLSLKTALALILSWWRSLSPARSQLILKGISHNFYDFY